MIFAIVGEELGLVGVDAVIARLRRLRVRRAAASRSRCNDPFGKRLAAGADDARLRAGGVNLAAVLGLAPLTGIPLPFVSVRRVEPRRRARGGRRPP